MSRKRRVAPVELHWVGEENSGNLSLLSGTLETELAWLNKRQKWWSAAIWLPGLSPGREFNTLAAHKKNIEEKVQWWFARANEAVATGYETARPELDK